MHRIPFSCGSICRRWQFAVSEPRQEEGGNAEEEDNTQDMDAVVASGKGLAASAEEAVLDLILVGRHSLDAEGPCVVS